MKMAKAMMKTFGLKTVKLYKEAAKMAKKGKGKDKECKEK